MADKLLVLGADRSSREALHAALGPLGLALVHPDSHEAAEAVVVIDARRDPAAGLAALERCKSQTPPPAVLLLARADQSPTSFAAWQAGSDAYLADPFDRGELLTIVERLAGDVTAAP